jgi:hypothetical protein
VLTWTRGSQGQTAYSTSLWIRRGRVFANRLRCRSERRVLLRERLLRLREVDFTTYGVEKRENHLQRPRPGITQTQLHASTNLGETVLHDASSKCRPGHNGQVTSSSMGRPWTQGWTPSHCAASWERLEAVQLLLDHGASADVNHRQKIVGLRCTGQQSGRTSSSWTSY